MEQEQLPESLSPLNNITNLEYNFNRIIIEQNLLNDDQIMVYALYLFYILLMFISLLFDLSLKNVTLIGLFTPIVILIIIFKGIKKINVFDLNDNTFHTNYTFFKIITFYQTKKISKKDILCISNNTVNALIYPKNEKNHINFQSGIYINLKTKKRIEIKQMILNNKTNLFHQYGICILLKNGSLNNIYLENADYKDSIEIASAISDYWKINQFTSQENYQIISFSRTENGIKLNDKLIPFTTNLRKTILFFKPSLLIFIIFALFWGPFFTLVDFNQKYNSNKINHQYIGESYFTSYYKYLIKKKFGINTILDVLKILTGHK